MRFPHGKYTAVGEAAADDSWVLPEEATELSRMLQCELLAPPQVGGNRDTNRDGSTDRDKEDNNDGESRHEEGGIKERRAGRNEGDSKASGLKEDSSSGGERVEMRQDRTKRSMGMATKKAGRIRVFAE